VNRRVFTASAVGAALGIPLAAVELTRASGRPASSQLPYRPLPVPSSGIIRTAVAIGPGVNVIDLAGSWEVFQDAAISRSAAQFELFTVAGDKTPVEASGGLTITPTYSYDTAPQPQVVVVPAHQSTDRTVRWLRNVAVGADLIISVCTGAFVLAETGLLDGKTATTHHNSYDDLASSFPAIHVVRGRRFVEHDHLATAGGLTAGIDLALRVVERYLGRSAADATARYMEYTRRTGKVA
jgi:transcriptional regulator GlxA family with amidase domain